MVRFDGSVETATGSRNSEEHTTAIRQYFWPKVVGLPSIPVRRAQHFGGAARLRRYSLQPRSLIGSGKDDTIIRSPSGT